MSESLRVNTLSAPAKKAPRRVGRGMGSHLGKTAGRGHKGQRARAGGRRSRIFEGGQMPLNRRVPKRGFNSRLARITANLRLSDIEGIQSEEITLAVLKESGLLTNGIKRARIYQSGKISRAVTIRGIPITKGARAAVEAAGGKVVEAAEGAKTAATAKPAEPPTTAAADTPSA